MGYQIQYGETAIKKYIPEVKRRSHFNIKALSILLTIVIILSLLISKRDAVIDFLLPGDGQVTRSAITNMVSKIKSGEQLDAAIEVFCLEIIRGANIPR